MKMVRSLLLSLPLLGAALLTARDSSACGGCFVPPTVDTQVTGHLMIFSTSKTQTTLYDQIEYVGAPESFSWVLPIHGQVDVGLSADAMFAFLHAASSVQVLPPPLNCPEPPEGCNYASEDEDFACGGNSGTGGDGGVTVITQEVVGPYETVQLEASDPMALQTWLADHGYEIPDDIKPVINGYQKEGFGFLAMKLVPGQGIQAMRPVRITAPGASLTLPLRMVAAGTGALTPITLFVVGEGRHQAANFPNLAFDPEPIVYHWEDGSSNYGPLIKGLFEGSGGLGWLTQSADHFSKSNLVGQVQQVVQSNPGQTDWGDPDNNVTEEQGALEDLETLFSGMNDPNIWLTRMHAQLSREALIKDLNLEAAPEQAPVSRLIQAKYSDGPVPECPDYSWCTDNDGGNFNGVGQGKDEYVGGKGSCAVERSSGSDGVPALVLGLGLAAAAGAIRRRRK
jgi:hypothetical protein